MKQVVVHELPKRANESVPTKFVSENLILAICDIYVQMKDFEVP